MSYLVAFVKFSPQRDEFPAACYRTDIGAGDSVIVILKDRRFATALVASVKYLNWNCHASVACKMTEANIVDNQLRINPGVPRKVGLVLVEDLTDVLRTRGWVPFLSNKHVYKTVFAYNNASSTGRIWVRANGVDLQVLPYKQPLPERFRLQSNELIKEGRFVRHFLSHTSFNLFEGIVRFAEAFESNHDSYDRFFVPQGRSNRQTADQKSRVAETKNLNNDGGSDDWRSDWCEGMNAWYDEMMERD